MRIRSTRTGLFGVLSVLAMGAGALTGCADDTGSGPPASGRAVSTSSDVSLASAPATPPPGGIVEVDPATKDQITSVTARAIEDYNTGNLQDLRDISCGALRTDLDAADPESFAAEARSDLNDRGRGIVAEIWDITVLNEFGSAAVVLQYERHVEGLDAANKVLASAVYQKTGEIWQICGL